MPPFSWYVALPLLALTGLLIYWLVQIGAFIANHFGMWWAAHGGWVIAIGSVLLFLFVLLPQGWRAWVAFSRHRQEVEDRVAQRQLLLTTRLAVEIGGQHGFNTRLQGRDLLVESINPLSLAPASKTSNFFLDAPSDDREPVEDEEEELAPLEMISLSELLRDGEILPDEEESIIGYERDGEPVVGRLFDIQDNIYNSIFIVGDQGYGKSSLAVLLAAYTVFHRGRLLVIDPEKGQAQSLTERLGPLVHPAFLLCEIADTPQKAEQLLSIAEQEIAEPGDYPLCLLIDELSMIARAAETNMGKWAAVGKRILVVAEDYATRGRKRIRRSVAMGQFTQGKKSGGTALRYAMANMVFRIDQKQARLVLEPEDAAIAPTLVPGEVIVIPSRSSEPKVQMQVVYPDEEGLQMIAQAMLSESDLVSGAFQPAFQENLQEDLKRPGNILEMTPETAWRAKVRRVRELRKKNRNQRQIIETIWGVRPGGSQEYARARDEYLSIMEQITQEDAGLSSEEG